MLTLVLEELGVGPGGVVCVGECTRMQYNYIAFACTVGFFYFSLKLMYLYLLPLSRERRSKRNYRTYYDRNPVSFTSSWYSNC